ncbi:MAG: Gfo/Idh/MocA family oxidoreductase [Clostridia bacterium]|nr:Gfo/Idh/MocA family oxidoreductase [Clostridia bacterium]
MLRYAIIGFGGLGRVHLSNLEAINKERGDLSLCAICGTTAENFKKSVSLNLGTADVSGVDITNVNFYDDYKELIDVEKPDFVVTALPTYLHEEVAVYALDRGVHTFSEKPMALNLEQCQNMIDASEKSGAFLMIGQCARFQKTVQTVKGYIESGIYGEVYRAEFQRYSQTPMWTWNNWILDPELSGGCVIDMHIHDVDLVNYLFGIPETVRSVMTEKKVKRESVFSQYEMAGGAVILTRGDWSLPQKIPFSASALICFEKACVKMRSDGITVYTDDEIITPDITGEDSHVLEMREFLRCITEGVESEITSPRSVKESVRIALAEVESAETKKKVIL